MICHESDLARSVQAVLPWVCLSFVAEACVYEGSYDTVVMAMIMIL